VHFGGRRSSSSVGIAVVVAVVQPSLAIARGLYGMGQSICLSVCPPVAKMPTQKRDFVNN